MPMIVSALHTHEPRSVFNRKKDNYVEVRRREGSCFIEERLVERLREALQSVSGCCLDNEAEQERVLTAVLEAL